MSVDRVRAVVARHTAPPPDDAPLEIDSITLVSIIEDLELELDLRVRPADVRPENFGSITAIAAFVDRRSA